MKKLLIFVGVIVVFCLYCILSNALELRKMATTEERQEVIADIAEKYDLKFIPLQDKFDKAENMMPADYWLIDGVHPTSMGYEIIKREWIKAFKSL